VHNCAFHFWILRFIGPRRLLWTRGRRPGCTPSHGARYCQFRILASDFSTERCSLTILLTPLNNRRTTTVAFVSHTDEKRNLCLNLALKVSPSLQETCFSCSIKFLTFRILTLISASRNWFRPITRGGKSL